MSEGRQFVCAWAAALAIVVGFLLTVPWLSAAYSSYTDWVWCQTHSAQDWPNTYHDPIFHGCP